MLAISKLLKNIFDEYELEEVQLSPKWKYLPLMAKLSDSFHGCMITKCGRIIDKVLLPVSACRDAGNTYKAVKNGPKDDPKNNFDVFSYFLLVFSLLSGVFCDVSVAFFITMNYLPSS